MVSKNRINNLEKQVPRQAQQEPQPDLSELTDQELRRIVELTDDEGWTPKEEEEFKVICEKVKWPDTKKWNELTKELK